MPNTTQSVTWDELLDSIATGAAHPDDTNWKIYRYLQNNYKTIGSVTARTLLAAYMKLHVKRMSLVDSCMLGMAVKISETYGDFKLSKFLEAWGYDSCLRAQDLQRQTGKDGRQYLSLKERVERALQSYRLHHPEECNGECEGIVSMYAAKVFEKEINGRKLRYVKLVATNGSELIADSHQFPCRPWEISGRIFNVLTRVSKQGNERVSEIVASAKRVDEAFSAEVGFVEFIDESHGHIHVYDSQSRHFVADKSAHTALKISVGNYVRFCPIIANGDHFKSAAIVSVMDKYEGRKAFGIYEAKVEYANVKDRYIRYSLESAIRYTPEGNIIKAGFASTANLPEDVRNGMVQGSHVRLILFLKRGKDGMKHNYVADIF
ncbi:hypothetical protein [Prevotella sp.]|jgi:hypothetical protein|uniref:hypothetical protein n=1 Tax=uncultured Prevotella sp. TaxID=159272 RepID=UPI0025DAEE01|nr:hypothetical protein [Prevotella sp.]MCI7370595.1 hypothetical protein [Prevotella sp.]MDY4645011.1 hypothetical protein [Prevotella sp.]